MLVFLLMFLLMFIMMLLFFFSKWWQLCYCFLWWWWYWFGCSCDNDDNVSVSLDVYHDVIVFFENDDNNAIVSYGDDDIDSVVSCDNDDNVSVSLDVSCDVYHDVIVFFLKMMTIMLLFPMVRMILMWLFLVIMNDDLSVSYDVNNF